jgi:DNA-binding transcriptional MerR regulator
MTLPGVPIGVASIRSGVRVPTIRYYEQIGLLPKPPRTKSNWRLYSSADLRRLAFIRRARGLGFDIEAVRALLTLQDDPDQSCSAADTIARTRLAEVQQRLDSLTALKAELERMVAACSLGRIADCQVIGALADRIDRLGDHGRSPVMQNHRNQTLSRQVKGTRQHDRAT